MSWLVIGLGAAAGACLRWALAMWLNAMHQHLPFGTLAANLAGGYLIGVAVSFFAAYPGLTPEWRLLVITGFLGGLTTFSSFSAESVGLLVRGDYAWALAHAAIHLVGSIGMCIAGMATYRALAG